jgi:hypothetical protein
MPFISFYKKPSARTGNIIFQYLICKTISILYGHTYIPIEEVTDKTTNVYMVYEDNIRHVLSNSSNNTELPKMNIICDGFFQQSDYYVPYREQLLTNIAASGDYWIGTKGNRQYISDFLTGSYKIDLTPNDIVVSLRLDDFIQHPCPTSDIVPPQYYMNIIENWCSIRGTTEPFSKLYIICDTIRHDWERKYLEYFQKWDYVLIQEDLLHDCNMMRDCHNLIHSNSTLCWITSFFSTNPNKVRFIPKTNFYGGQSLNKICSTDTIRDVAPMPHHEVYSLDYDNWLISQLYPLAYCIPDEMVVSDEVLDTVLEKKHMVIADLIPNEPLTYRFSSTQENEYNDMYRESRFAFTRKKGGWDCLRHYEIMANGCIPIFKDLQQCPPFILSTFPKELIMQANRELLPWKSEYKANYDTYAKNMISHIKQYCTCSATVEYFFSKLPHFQHTRPQNVLLIMGNCGINYTRETFWIGMKKYIQSVGGIATEYPKMDFMYNSYTGDKSRLYGNGFTYSMRLDDDITLDQKTIEEMIDDRKWDLIIYGKVGPDELHEGSHPHMPYWSHVFKRYSRDEIVFLYGGDEAIDVTHYNRYRWHILFHSRYAQCFVRELIK